MKFLQTQADSMLCRRQASSKQRMTPSGVLKSISTGGSSVRNCSKVSSGTMFSGMVMSLPGMGSGPNYYLAAVLAICSANVHVARV
jgi:hypothetical protein